MLRAWQNSACFLGIDYRHQLPCLLSCGYRSENEDGTVIGTVHYVVIEVLFIIFIPRSVFASAL